MIKILFRKFFAILIIWLFIIFSSLISIYYYSNKLYPFIIAFSENKAKRIASLIINNSILKNKDDKEDLNDLFVVEYNNEGEIIFIDLNNNKINIILDNMSKNIKNDLNDLNNFINTNENIDVNNKKKLILINIPLSLARKNYLLSYLGPMIPVNLSIIGNSSSNLDVDIVDYGINNALIKVYVDVRINCKIVLPFLSKFITVENRIPLCFRIINGKLPNYYKPK